MRAEDGFQQPVFPYPNPYSDDPVFQSLLRRLLPRSIAAPINEDLARWGTELQGPIRAIGALCDTEHPSLRQYDHWGRRVDELHTSQGWRAMKAIAFKEGTIAIAYDREKWQQWARVYMFAKVFMFDADCRMIMCPFSMTDGCARVLELYGTREMKEDVLPRLLSRDPTQGFTAGQWMTERPGGSDVSLTETKAVRSSNNSAEAMGAEVWELDGFKWFSSATDGDVALALARTGPEAAGARSISLFLVPLRLPLLKSPPATQLSALLSESTLPRSVTRASHLVSSNASSAALSSNNGILIHRLKSKVGTWPVPTAELSLNQTLGYRIGELNQGVKLITPVLNITRIHSAIDSVSYLARCLQIAKAYAGVREVASATVSGGPAGRALLRDVPLHTHTLAKVEVTYRALLQLVFGAVTLLGRVEYFTSSMARAHGALPKVDEENAWSAEEDVALLRLLTPVVKGYISHYAAGAMEECMIALGGQGYMEETGIGRMIRDALVEKIWEGTPNIMALDVLRACRGGQSGRAFIKFAQKQLANIPSVLHAKAQPQISILRSAILELESLLIPLPTSSSSQPSNVLPRPLFFLLGHATSALFLLEHTLWSLDPSSGESENEREAGIAAFIRWVQDGPTGAGLAQAIYEVEKVVQESSGPSVDQLDELLVYGGASTRTRGGRGAKL